MADAAIKTSTWTHPYTITVQKWSTKTFNLSGVPLLRDQDDVSCSQHGPQKILGTAVKARDIDPDGNKFAKVGDTTTCGAVIATGDPNIQLS
mgnify:CR=1 FL=1|jgi:uncharacterized Zn-binding protein involved in type VI secretion